MIHRPFKLAIVGGGPSAFFSASRVLSRLPEAQVHIYDRLWAPHGLVRYGVAPDHPEVKNVTHKFDETARDPRFKFFGNVSLSHPDPFPHNLSIPITSLFPHYTHLLLAHGASQPVRLSGLDPVHTRSALSFVHWYTGHPFKPSPPPLSSTTHLTLIGHGNVSLDIARMLQADPSSLHALDIPSSVIEHLKSSSIQHISIVSRRGPAQVAFTAKELRELLNLPTASMVPIPQHVLDAATVDKTLTRQQTRILDLLRKGSKNKYVPGPDAPSSKSWSLEFFKTPVSSSSADKSITFELNTLDDQDRARGTGEHQVQSTDLIVPSLGYRSDPFQSLTTAENNDEWFDSVLGRVRNSNEGRVYNADGKRVKNVFTSGWAANGAKGVIASTMYDAYAVSDALVAEHLASADEPSLAQPFESSVFPMNAEPDMEIGTVVPSFLGGAARTAGKRIVSYDDWKKIDEEEVRRGANVGKEKERMVWEEVDGFLSK